MVAPRTLGHSFGEIRLIDDVGAIGHRPRQNPPGKTLRNLGQEEELEVRSGLGIRCAALPLGEGTRSPTPRSDGHGALVGVGDKFASVSYLARVTRIVVLLNISCPWSRFTEAVNGMSRTNVSAVCANSTVLPTSVHVPVMSASRSPPP